MSFRRALGRTVLRLWGWNLDGAPPGPDKYVLIAAPHTSNWDFLFMLAYAFHYDVHVSWLGKRQMFDGPLNGIFRRLGGIPVERASAGNMVGRMAALFESRERLCLIVPAEGTRGYVEYWKSGFYHIARAAGVPVVTSFLDYPKKHGGFGTSIPLTGDISADMDRFRAFYDGMQGKYPEKTGRIRLKEEDYPQAASA